MNKSNDNIKDKMVILFAWLVALSLLYLVYMKFKIMFHSM
jgi:hypothetical protein